MTKARSTHNWLGTMMESGIRLSVGLVQSIIPILLLVAVSLEYQISNTDDTNCINLLQNSTGEINCSLPRLLQDRFTACCDFSDNAKCEYFTINGVCGICTSGVLITMDMSWDTVTNGHQTATDTNCNCTRTLFIDLTSNKTCLSENSSLAQSRMVRRLNMSRNNLHRISENVFGELEALERLDLSGNMLTGIRRHDFYGLENLKQLRLAQNRIHDIETGSFGSLARLEMLDLSDNRISVLQSFTFDGLVHLKSLYLRGNKLNEPHLVFLKPIIRLITIDISNNSFTQIAENACRGHVIRNFFLRRSSSLRFIMADAFSNCSEIERIDLSGNHQLAFIDQRSVSNVSLPNLKLLNITNTQIRMLPDIANTTQVISLGKRVETRKCFPMVKISPEDNNNNNDHDSDSGRLQTSEEDTCGPFIVSNKTSNFSSYVGDIVHITCHAVGSPWPNIVWKHIPDINYTSATETALEHIVGRGYTLKLKIVSLNVSGIYRCLANSSNRTDYKDFNVHVNHVDIGLRVLASNAHAVVVTWNKTKRFTHHVVLYRAFESTAHYTRQHISEYWKIFKIKDLKPRTHYEICIASYNDVNDKSCVRTLTTHVRSTTSHGGIHHNVLAIVVLTTAGVVFSVFLLTTIYRCAKKIHVIAKHNIFIVGSQTREQFDDVTETTFLYENQYTDLMESPDRTLTEI